jgi:Protein of unknown function (DUF3631)
MRETLRETDAATPEELGARQSDVWRPLLAIADLAGGHWPETARTAALALHGVAEDEGDYGLLLLEDLRTLFQEHGTRHLFSAIIAEELKKREDRPWPEYHHDKAITVSGIARLLRRFGVTPHQVRVGPDSQKGYSLEHLGPVFDTYLPHTLRLSETSETSGGERQADRNVSLVSDNLGDTGALSDQDARLARGWEAAREAEQQLERAAIQTEGT